MFRIARYLLVPLVALATLAPGAHARMNGAERALVDELNAARAQHGLGRLRASPALGRAADAHNRDMLARDFFDHVSSDGSPFDRRVRRYARAALVGETLAQISMRSGGTATIVQMWLNSGSHRDIVLEPRFRRIGVGRRWGTLGSGATAVVTADFAR